MFGWLVETMYKLFVHVSKESGDNRCVLLTIEMWVRATEKSYK